MDSSVTLQPIAGVEKARAKGQLAVAGNAEERTMPPNVPQAGGQAKAKENTNAKVIAKKAMENLAMR